MLITQVDLACNKAESETNKHHITKNKISCCRYSKIATINSEANIIAICLIYKLRFLYQPIGQEKHRKDYLLFFNLVSLRNLFFKHLNSNLIKVI